MGQERSSVLGRLRRNVEALMHPWRRRVASGRIHANARPGRVVFLCYGNICRSPFAEMLFRRETERAWPGAFDVTSAGLIGPNRRPPAAALTAAAKVGIDLSAHRSKLVTTEMVRESSLVAVMSAEQARLIRGIAGSARTEVLVLGDLDPGAIDARTIRDPWDSPDYVFDASYARIDRCVRSLVRLVAPST